MADIDFGALASTNVMQANDQHIVVRGGVPYRYVNNGPAFDAVGNLSLAGTVFPYVQLTRSGIGNWLMGGDGTAANAFSIRFNAINCMTIDNGGNLFFGAGT